MNTPFDPSDLSAFRVLDIDHLALLPTEENDRFEYKSGRTPDSDLGQKIERAASGFWNSGGGFIVCGVDSTGAVDGGVSATVGRQSRRDWVDQFVTREQEAGVYAVRFLQGTPPRGNLGEGNGVLLVAFRSSSIAPHMASDHRYYIRAGAHTVPAPHFIVEAIRARRALEAPLLTFFLRPKDGASGLSELEVVNLSPAPALDVTVKIIPTPTLLRRSGSDGVFKVRALDAQHPAQIPFTHVAQGPNDWVDVDQNHRIVLEYKDIAGRDYRNDITFLPRWDLPKPLGDVTPLERIAIALGQIDSRLQILLSQKR